MIDFITGCCSLFTDTFNAVMDEDYLSFQVSYLVIQICFGLFFMFQRGSKKM